LIHFMFGSRVGFSGSADRMALFPVTSNPTWRQPKPSWIISNGHISATAHWIHLYSVHRAVIFAIAQLSCMLIESQESNIASMWPFVKIFYMNKPC